MDDEERNSFQTTIDPPNNDPSPMLVDGDLDFHDYLIFAESRGRGEVARKNSATITPPPSSGNALRKKKVDSQLSMSIGGSNSVGKLLVGAVKTIGSRTTKMIISGSRRGDYPTASSSFDRNSSEMTPLWHESKAVDDAGLAAKE